MRKRDKSVTPDFHIIKIDERNFWSESVQQRTKEVYGVYAFDRNSYTYCCEATPSYELLFLGTDFVGEENLSEEQKEELDTWVLTADSEPVTYMHVRSVEQLCEKYPQRTQKANINLETDESHTEVEAWNAVFDQLCEGWSTGSLQF